MIGHLDLGLFPGHGEEEVDLALVLAFWNRTLWVNFEIPSILRDKRLPFGMSLYLLCRDILIFFFQGNCLKGVHDYLQPEKETLAFALNMTCTSLYW